MATYAFNRYLEKKRNITLFFIFIILFHRTRTTGYLTICFAEVYIHIIQILQNRILDDMHGKTQTIFFIENQNFFL